MSKSFDGLSNQSFVIKTNRNVLAVYLNPVRPDEKAAYSGCTEGKIKLHLSSYVRNQDGSRRTTAYADYNLDIGQFVELELMYALAEHMTSLVNLELAKGMPISLIEGKELVPRVYNPKVYDRVKDQAGNSPASIMTLEFQQFYKGEPKRNPFMLHIQQGSAPATRTASGGTNFAISKFVVGKTETGGNKDVTMMMSMALFRYFVTETRRRLNEVEGIWQETQLPAFMQAWDAYKGNPGPMPGLAGLLDQVLTRLAQIQQALGLQALQPAPTPVMQKAMEQARERDAKRQGYSQPGPAPMPPQGAPYQGQPGSMAMPPQGTPYQGQPGPVPMPPQGAMPQQGAPYQGPPMTGAMPPQGTVYPQGPAPQAPPVTGAMPPQGMPPQGPAPQAPPVMGAMPPQTATPQAPPAAGAPAQPQGEPMDLKILADQVVYLQSGASVMRCQDPAGVQMSLVFKGQPPREFLDAQKSGTPIKGRFAKKDLPGIGKCLVPA